MWLFLLIVVLFILVIGSITDIRTREVPDWISYAGICAGFGLRFIWSSYTWSSVYIIEGITGFAVFFALACALYYFGQWGGGDSKVLMAVGVCLGLSMDFNHIILAFVINSIWIGGVYGAVWSVCLAFKNWNSFKKEFMKKLHFQGRFRVVPLVFLLVIVVLSFLIKINSIIQIFVIMIAVTVPLFYYVAVFVRTVEKVAMHKFVSASELTEGDWIVNDVFVNKKRICGPSDLGVSLKQIENLKKSRIKKILIKVGIPFVPVLLFGYLFTLFFGNPLFWLI
ncbi:A24 family peptidase [Candidatus Woesearchaeota archaeon]|nr:A24 family peptidase [Candidatus Woesearchaeota archaeon]